MKTFQKISTTDLCDYGCSRTANYLSISGSKCCSSHFLKCPAKKIATHKHKNPYSTAIETEELCEFGCNSIAKYLFKNGKKCCSPHFNSCAGKRKEFSLLNHDDRTSKSLKTRIRLGITKSSQIKGTQTRIKNGHYEKLAQIMKEHWMDSPWKNSTQCPILNYKDSPLTYQGTHECSFLFQLEEKFGFDWLLQNVKRGPSIWYVDPTDNSRRLYISDFQIGNTIYEVKSSWTWNKNGEDELLENKNKAKLAACRAQGYDVILVLDGKENIWQ